MADWYELNLRFTKTGDLEGLKSFLEDLDYDAPIALINELGTMNRRTGVPAPVMWRCPTLNVPPGKSEADALTALLEEFGFEGEGWWFYQWEEKTKPDVADGFTFGSSKPKWVVEGLTATNGFATVTLEKDTVSRFVVSGSTDVPVWVFSALIAKV